jgi:hypothetical protein
LAGLGDAHDWDGAGDVRVDVGGFAVMLGHEDLLLLGGRVVDSQEVVKAAGEVSFEAPQCAFGRLSFGSFAGEVLAGLGVVLGAGDRDDVQRVVELAVSASVQAVLVALA